MRGLVGGVRGLGGGLHGSDGGCGPGGGSCGKEKKKKGMCSSKGLRDNKLR